MNDPIPAVYEVTPAFGVEYVDDVGVTRKGPLAALWSTRFEYVNQARSPVPPDDRGTTASFCRMFNGGGVVTDCRPAEKAAAGVARRAADATGRRLTSIPGGGVMPALLCRPGCAWPVFLLADGHLRLPHPAILNELT